MAKSKTGGAYCSGFTFEVVIAAALERGLLDDIEPYQIAQFQREWYGVPKHARVRQALVALENLGIGSEVSQNGARAGDFIIFSRWDGTGHSAIFLEWQWKDGRRVGFRYRSAQSETLGVGDRIEYFDDSGFPEGNVIPMYFFVGRLK